MGAAHAAGVIEMGEGAFDPPAALAHLPEPIALVKPAAHTNRISAEDRVSATKS
jgi:hypothetical protein